MSVGDLFGMGMRHFCVYFNFKLNFFVFIAFSEETHLSDHTSSPVASARNVASLMPNTANHPASPASGTADPWPSQSDEDIDRLVAMHQNRHNSLSSLGVSIEMLVLI